MQEQFLHLRHSSTLRQPFCSLFRMLPFRVVRSFFHNTHEINKLFFRASDIIITIFNFIQAYEIFTVVEK